MQEHRACPFLSKEHSEWKGHSLVAHGSSTWRKMVENELHYLMS